MVCMYIESTKKNTVNTIEIQSFFKILQPEVWSMQGAYAI